MNKLYKFLDNFGDYLRNNFGDYLRNNFGDYLRDNHYRILLYGGFFLRFGNFFFRFGGFILRFFFRLGGFILRFFFRFGDFILRFFFRFGGFILRFFSRFGGFILRFNCAQQRGIIQAVVLLWQSWSFVVKNKHRRQGERRRRVQVGGSNWGDIKIHLSIEYRFKLFHIKVIKPIKVSINTRSVVMFIKIVCKNITRRRQTTSGVHFFRLDLWATVESGLPS